MLVSIRHYLNPMIYIIGGPGKTGSSAISQALAQELNIPRLYGGGYMRKEAIKAGYVNHDYTLPSDEAQWDLDQANVPGFRTFCEQSHRDIDWEMELYLMQGMVDSLVNGHDVIIESKTMGRFLHAPKFGEFLNQINVKSFADPAQFIDPQALIDHSRAVWLHSDLAVRAQRLISKKNNGKQGPEGSPISINAEELHREMDKLAERQLIDRADYASKYGMDDYPLATEMPGNNLFGTIIDSSKQSEEQTYLKVKEALGLISE